MARKPRIDNPDTWHHVMNRGVARRTMFESDWDVQRFTDRLQVAIERCGIEIHCYAVLQTHYHLLIRSSQGLLSQALHLIQSPFARRFNRTRDRDGPLHRSRFRSIPVESLRYRRFLVRYIDANPVDAGLTAGAASYPHCSAFQYAHRHGPAWLCRSWIESEVQEVSRTDAYDPGAYAVAFPPTLTSDQLAFVDARPERAVELARQADFLLTQTRSGWERWIVERAESADGRSKFTTLLPLTAIDQLVEDITVAEEPRHGNSKHTRRAQLHLALGRMVAGATMAEIAHSLGMSARSAQGVWHSVRRRIGEDEAFRSELAHLANEAIQSFWNGV